MQTQITQAEADAEQERIRRLRKMREAYSPKRQEFTYGNASNLSKRAPQNDSKKTQSTPRQNFLVQLCCCFFTCCKQARRPSISGDSAVKLLTTNNRVS